MFVQRCARPCVPQARSLAMTFRDQAFAISTEREDMHNLLVRHWIAQRNSSPRIPNLDHLRDVQMWDGQGIDVAAGRGHALPEATDVNTRHERTVLHRLPNR